MCKKFFKNIDKVLTSSIALILTAALGFIYWIVSPDELIPFYFLVIEIIVFFIICVAFYAFLNGRKEEIVYRLPRIINFLEEKSLFIVEDSDLLSQDLLTTISYYDEKRDVETYIGIGIVQIQNRNRFFQVEFLPKEDLSEDSIFSNAIERKQYDLLIIRPGIHKIKYTQLLGGIN
nr:hypothetical protein [uncultured Sphaerochaeta sp.]